MTERHTYFIEATKRKTGQVVIGTTKWDGLADLYAVDTADGTVYVTVLDNIHRFDRVYTA